MNLWQRLEERGREALKLGQSWHLYYVDLDKSGYGWAEVKFARKDTQGIFKTTDSAFGNIEYYDLR
ncbi:hypothetical protein [Paenibacillus sp. ISL-20]|uniref:hypothetical protein n=1 Tax=Paenibacillus sp. ISL-20 TaxID=2819163 RepID=UPI001BEC1795|nr:hypothetical protein [Paenibacillus sp. ISL-20]MBT2759919.1 hypothetical protein [Paenibacillus sp. ISL-20]